MMFLNLTLPMWIVDYRGAAHFSNTLGSIYLSFKATFNVHFYFFDPALYSYIPFHPFRFSSGQIKTGFQGKSYIYLKKKVGLFEEEVSFGGV